MSIFANPLNEMEEYDNLENGLGKIPGPFQVSGLPDSAKAHVISELKKETRPWKLVVTYDEARARELYEDLKCFTDNVWLYPAKDLLFFSADIEGRQISRERIDVWRHMSSDRSGCVVTTVDGLMDKLETPEQFGGSVFTIDENDTLDPEKLIRRLSDFGYDRTAEVDGMGQFAVRGGIIDIYPLTEELPVRIELWDDKIDSIRSFDPENQRSVEKISKVTVYPAREKETGGSASFLKYWDREKSILFLDETDRLREKAEAVEEEFKEGMAGRLESGQIAGEEIPELFSAGTVMKELETDCTVCLNGLDVHLKDFNVRRSFALEAKSMPSYKNSFEMLIADMKKFRQNHYRMVLLTPSRTRASRLAESLREYELTAFVGGNTGASTGIETEAVPGSVLVLYGNLHRGFEYPLIRFAVISESDILGNAGARKRHHAKQEFKGSRISSLSELSEGDFVVHEEHGLGIYRGLDKITTDGITRDYIKIEYRDGDNCYVPATKLDAIQKYASADAKSPKLNRLNGTEWNRTRQKVRGAVAEIAKELVTVYSARLNGKGYVYGPDTVWQKEFEEMFPYEETEDQIKAIEETKSDMEQGKIMDRLICGDVGYGKTEVALRAAFKTVQEGRQVIFLVPTTILAQQHFNTFTQRMKNFPVRVDLLSRFRTPAEQKKTLSDFSKGLIDVLIGTHRVLSRDIRPRNLGLLVIDEEQRFGVAHKEKLKEMKKNVDVLTLTATPIPRTLHMSLAGIRDLSVLEEPPLDRQPIQTYVMEYHDETVREAIRREVARGGQVYYVYNRVNNILDVTSHIRSLVPEAVVSCAHGQMNERELEQVMLDFINGEIDVLVSTTIIETGLDIPNVNTMIIQDADKMGLSQLYQLRGRVGRSARTAYAFLLYRRGRLLSEESEKRLKAIREFTELGSGIKIAMRDLEIRGAGNVLGAEQHGHMQAVGYDLYCKMLNHAVKALRNAGDASAVQGEAEEEFVTGVEADADAYIPSSYIKNEDQKLDIYKRIASIESQDDYLDMQDELMDRFGDIPEPVGNLLMIALIRSSAHQVFVTEVLIHADSGKLTVLKDADLKAENIPDLIREFHGDLSIKTGDKVEFLLRKSTGKDTMMKEVLYLVVSMHRFLLPEKPQKH